MCKVCVHHFFSMFYDHQKVNPSNSYVHGFCLKFYHSSKESQKADHPVEVERVCDPWPAQHVAVDTQEHLELAS